MNHTYTTLINTEDGEVEEVTLKTGDVYDENKLLIDLERQPEYIRNKITETIAHARETRGKFNYMKFLKFCKKHKLVNIIKQVDNFIPLLAAKSIKR